jgi:dimethylargininase
MPRELIALTRAISPAIGRCELTHVTRRPIDLTLARAQHAAYEDALRAAGCRIEQVSAAPDMPDSVFIEDAALVFDELAIVTRPGAESRRGETPAVADALGKYRELRYVEPPATVDGGDVLVIGRRVFVGRSERTNGAGCEQLQRILTSYAYEVVAVPVHGCLHLKSAVTAVGNDLLLANPQWLPLDSFVAFDRVDVHPREPGAANALRIESRVIYSTSFPRTLELLRRRGLDVRTVDTSEVEKAEGALTCCSLVVPTDL